MAGVDPALAAIAIVEGAPAGEVTIRTPRGLFIMVLLDVDVEPAYESGAPGQAGTIPSDERS